jgi:hypothetical protein
MGGLTNMGRTGTSRQSGDRETTAAIAPKRLIEKSEYLTDGQRGQI